MRFAARTMAGLVVAWSMGCASPQISSEPQPAEVQTAGAEDEERDTVLATPAEVESEFRQLFRASEEEVLAELAEAEVDTPRWDIPITINDAVERWLEYFQGDGRENFQLYLNRAGRYESMMRSVLRDAGLPEDLVYLSLIESGFSPRAYSRARAVGLWQFIAGTGRRYDLHIS